jgi:REP element-mobilizing transposase RayT
VPSAIAAKAGLFWMEIPRHFENTALDEYVIMPNHMHGLIVLKKDQDAPMKSNGCDRINDNAGGRYIDPLHSRKKGPPPKSIGAIVGNFKAQVTRWCHRNGFPFFQWQENYHDYIIRNSYEYRAIRQYIINNPPTGLPTSSIPPGINHDPG